MFEPKFAVFDSASLEEKNTAEAEFARVHFASLRGDVGAGGPSSACSLVKRGLSRIEQRCL